MAQLPKLDYRVSDCLGRAESSSDAAAQALLFAAEYLRAGESLPVDLIDYLAGAIEAAMVKPAASRGRALLHELKLTAQNRRPADADWYVVGQRFDELRRAGESQNASASQIAVEFGIGESTAKRLWRKYLDALATHAKAGE